MVNLWWNAWFLWTEDTAFGGPKNTSRISTLFLVKGGKGKGEMRDLSTARLT
jgi:hypothetical protein